MFSSIRSLFPKEGIWRDLTLVAGGTAAGQVFSILAAPLLSRLYGASDFGTLAVYTSVTAVAAALSTFSYHLAIPVPKEDDEAIHLTIISLLCVVLVAACAGIAGVLFHRRILALAPSANVAHFLPFVPAGILGLGSYEVVSQWAARKKAFGIIARTSVRRSLIQVSAQLIGGFAKLGSFGLVVGQLLGQWSGSLTIGRQAFQTERATVSKTTAAQLLATARAYRQFPLITSPGALVNVLDSNAAPLMFAYFFGSVVTGYFALGHRLLSIPFMMIGSSAQKVFFPLAAAAHHNGTLSQETWRMFQRLAIIACPMVFLLSSSAPEVFSVVLGAEWREAGAFLQWISLRTCFTLIVFPLIPLMYVLGKQALGTAFNLAQLVVRVGAICIGSLRHDAHLAVALLGGGTSVLWIGYLFHLLSLSGRSVWETLKVLLKELCIGAATAAPVIAIKALKLGDLAVALAAAACAVVAAAMVLKRLHNERAPHGPTEALNETN